jgi:hypothetical protein
MRTTLARAIAVGIAALATLTFTPAVLPAVGATPTCTGVWVVVQSDEDDAASASAKCATEYTTGVQALTSAGYALEQSSGMVTRIDALPTDSNYNTNGGYYWSYWHTTVTSSGALGTWNYYSTGATQSAPTQGEAEGWLLTKSSSATGPALTTISATESSSDTSSTPTASASASASASSSASTKTTTAATKTAVADAAKYLANNLPTEDDGASAINQTILGLSAAGDCSYASTIRSQLATLKQLAPDYIANNPGRAAILAIVAKTVGEDPTDFAGFDLIQQIANGTDTSTGQVGSTASSFTQSLAIIAYVRAGRTVPSAMLTNLTSAQDSSGAFGYSYGGTFYSDYDTTGLAIQALYAAGGQDSAVAKAVAWAVSEQNSSGYWPNPYSPVNSTGLLGSALELVGTDTGSATSWMISQQLSDGGLPNVLDGTDSDRWATQEGLYLLTSTTLVTVSLPLSTCAASSTATPTATTTSTASASATTSATTTAALATTGTAAWVEPIGLAGLALVVLGTALVVARSGRLSRRTRR